MNRTLYLGLPGSGKTTTLINFLEKELQETSADKIAYVSFTKKAISEAQERAFKRFGLSKKDMPFFKTLHSLAFSALGLTRKDVVNEDHLKELGERLGVNLIDEHNPFKPLALYNLARVKEVSFYRVWEKTYLIHTKTYDELVYIIKAYAKFKHQECLIDFTDMIFKYNSLGSPLPVTIAFVDEAQDLSTIQWQMLEKAFKNVSKLILAGDDDQCIYSWSGADKQKFLNFPGEKIILSNSYRCPEVISNFANRISGKIQKRYEKRLQGAAIAGNILELNDFEQAIEGLKNGEEWLILVRNRVDISRIKRFLIYHRLVFSIDGKNYIPYRHFAAINDFKDLLDNCVLDGSQAKNIADCAGLKNLYFDIDDAYNYKDIFGNIQHQDFRSALIAIYPQRLDYYYDTIQNKQFSDKPKIQLTTIHGAKGAECENVILSCDQSVLTYRAAQYRPDDEHRVFYVGVTRAKKNLYLLRPTKKRHYNMPRIM